jgi:hypothetical protein
MIAALLRRPSPAAQMGTASGTNSMLQRFGAVFGVAIASAVFSAYGRIGTAATFTDGFRPAVMVAAVLALLGALAGFAVGTRASAEPAAEAGPVSQAAATSVAA